MKLLLDQGLPRSTAAHLRQKGIDAVHVGEIALATAEDADILEQGRREDRTVVTLDADFHMLMALAGAKKPSVIRLRIEGLRGPEMADLLIRVLDKCRGDLQKGVLVSVHETGLRLRRLPVAR